MDQRLRKVLRRLHIDRTTVVAIVFIALAMILLARLYHLQITNGATYRENFTLQTTKTRELKATRGNIYDRNGNVLASNELSYTLTIEDSGSYDSSRERALYLNGEAYRIDKILNANGDALSNDFHIVLNDAGNYVFDVSGVSLLRFKADVYGHAYIEELTTQEETSTAEEMMDYLCSEDFFAIVRKDRPYTTEELQSVGLPEHLSKHELLNIVYVRYQLFTTSYRKYVPVSIATALSAGSVAALEEEMGNLTGIDIVEDTVRVYHHPYVFASLLGYTGKVSASDLSELPENDERYDSASVVGKSGIEKIMETSLQGYSGEESVNVDYLGRVLNVIEDATVEPVAGNDVYLTVDANLSVACYQLLEQRIAGILETVIINQKEFDTSNIVDTLGIRIPIDQVYNALFENNILRIQSFDRTNASENELLLKKAYSEKEAEVLARLSAELQGETETAYGSLDNEMREVCAYIVNDLLQQDPPILKTSEIDVSDETYLAWTEEESVSLRHFLLYAASKSWIDTTLITAAEGYLDSEEIYQLLIDYVLDALRSDTAFAKMLYGYLIHEDRIAGQTILLALYDQGVFDRNDDDYESLADGSISAYDFVIKKIHQLELTPAMLALDPCSGSAVITNPNTGEVLACVSYPGYDNNRLANTMDVAYYNLLAEDLSRPFYNKATQQETALGSTFKMVTASAGLEESAIDLETVFNCNGVFDLADTPLSCWLKTGHGNLNVIGGIENSCNVFFCNVAYRLGLNEEDNFSDSLALSKLQNYAQKFGMDKGSGLEIPEATPHVTDQYAIQSSIGQGTHAFTTTQLARYVSTLANRGTIYNLTIIDKETHSDGSVVTTYPASVEEEMSLQASTWDTIQTGMRKVIESKGEYEDMPVAIAGKTGTAQESRNRPSHALFITYAPYENPEIAMALRIGNGYASTNTMLLGKDIYQYYFNLVDEKDLLTGSARTDSVVLTQED